jgi:hypothetical protein
MNDNRKQTIRDLCVFLLLVAIAVAGRWGQPIWCFTPTAATAIFAGCYFAHFGIAMLVPLTALGIGDIALASHDNLGVMLVTYAAMTVPVLLGRWLAGSRGSASTLARFAVCGLLPATLFWLASNFAVWLFQSDYEKTLAGLFHCYAMAVPFFRWMIAGDLCYLSVLFACTALAGIPLASFHRQKAYKLMTSR